MNDEATFTPARSAALKALLMDTVASGGTSRTRRPVRARAFLLVALGLVFGLAGSGGAVWALNEHDSAQVPGSTTQPQADPDNLFPAWNDQMMELGNTATAVNLEFPDVYGNLWIDNKSITLHVGYYSGASEQRIAEYLSRLRAIPLAAPVTLAVAPVSFTHAKLLAAQMDIVNNQARWETIFGDKITGIAADEVTGEIHVGLNGVVTSGRMTAPNGTPIVLEEPMTLVLQAATGSAPGSDYLPGQLLG